MLKLISQTLQPSAVNVSQQRHTLGTQTSQRGNLAPEENEMAMRQSQRTAQPGIC